MGGKGSGQATNPNVAGIIAARLKGTSLKQIGQSFGLTRQRIEQICKKARVVSRKRLTQRSRHLLFKRERAGLPIEPADALILKIERYKFSRRVFAARVADELIDPQVAALLVANCDKAIAIMEGCPTGREAELVNLGIDGILQVKF